MQIFSSKNFLLGVILSASNLAFARILPPQYLTAVPDQDSKIPLYWFSPNANSQQLIYDDGSMEAPYHVFEEYLENKAAVKFSAPDPIFYLLKSKVFISAEDHFPGRPGNQYTGFYITAHYDSSGVPGEVFSGPFFAYADTNNWEVDGKWVEIVHNALGTKSQNFWIVFSWQSDFPTAPLIGGDKSFNQLRSYFGRFEVEDRIYKWHQLGDYNFMIEAEILVNNQIVHTLNAVDPDGFRIYRSSDSIVTISPENLIATVTGEVFQYVDSNLVNGNKYNYVSTAVYVDSESLPSVQSSAIPVQEADLLLDKNLISETLLLQGRKTDTLLISNTGDLDLYFWTEIYLEDTVLTEKQDKGGYKWNDSKNNPGPVFNWVDIEKPENSILSSNRDDIVLGPYEMNFSYSFYGNRFDSLWIDTNGRINFSQTSSKFLNGRLPNTQGFFNTICAYWDDLKLRPDTSKLYAYFGPDSTVISFVDWTHWLSSYANYTFQIILLKEGAIYFQYKTMKDTLNSATIGMQNEDGTTGLEVAYNEDYVSDSLVIEILPGWVSIQPKKGSISPHSNLLFEADLDAAYLPLGSYKGWIYLFGKDKNHLLERQTIQFSLDVDTVLSVFPQPKSVPASFSLEQNYPNPFNAVTQISFSLAKREKVNLVIYNLLGQKVRTLLEDKTVSGSQQVFWDGKDESGREVASGVYFYQLKTKDFTSTRKMVLLK